MGSSRKEGPEQEILGLCIKKQVGIVGGGSRIRSRKEGDRIAVEGKQKREQEGRGWCNRRRK